MNDFETKTFITAFSTAQQKNTVMEEANFLNDQANRLKLDSKTFYALHPGGYLICGALEG